MPGDSSGSNGGPDLSNKSDQELRTEIESRARPRTAGPKALFSIPEDPELEAASTSALIKALREKQRLIYGVDNREDFYQIQNASARTNAESVVALFDAADVTDLGNGRSRLKVISFKEQYRLCDDEPFAKQPVGAFCSGFLVGRDVVASAGHCVNPRFLSDVERLRFVFGFRMTSLNDAAIELPNSDIYSGKEIIHQRLTTADTDWSLIRLDREVANRSALTLRSSSTLTTGDAVYVIGHPCGLPLKYAPGATVRGNSEKSFFTANLDTYGGNSGSPVFGANHEVEGILVRGDTDFVRRGPCNVSLVVPTSGGRGEDVTRISEARPFIP